MLSEKYLWKQKNNHWDLLAERRIFVQSKREKELLDQWMSRQNGMEKEDATTNYLRIILAVF